MESKEQNKQTNKQKTRHRLVDTENKLLAARGEGSWGLDEKDEGSGKYKLVVRRRSQGCKASTGSAVDNIAGTVCGARRGPDISGASLCLTTVLYACN